MILIEPPIIAKFGRALRQRALSVFLREAEEAAKLHGEVSVLLTGDVEIRRLNRKFRGKDKATDVLSFPALHHREHGGARESGDDVAGDLAISVETGARQAEEHGHPLFVEVQILLLHGVLHLAGYDHETDGGEMARKEAALRRKFGLARGLIERSGPSLSAKNRGQGRGTRLMEASAASKPGRCGR
jgi:probable rRNA maturation factor